MVLGEANPTPWVEPLFSFRNATDLDPTHRRYQSRHQRAEQELGEPWFTLPGLCGRRDLLPCIFSEDLHWLVDGRRPPKLCVCENPFKPVNPFC